MRKTDIVKRQKGDYEKSLSSIIGKIEESKHRAITTVNKLLMERYWFIGETVVDLQEKSKWGDGMVLMVLGLAISWLKSFMLNPLVSGNSTGCELQEGGTFTMSSNP